jgi:hypothetical protein
MARPRQKVTKKRVNLCFSPTLFASAQALAFEQNESLSGMVERLLKAELLAAPNRFEQKSPEAEVAIASVQERYEALKAQAKKNVAARPAEGRPSKVA